MNPEGYSRRSGEKLPSERNPGKNAEPRDGDPERLHKKYGERFSEPLPDILSADYSNHFFGSQERWASSMSSKSF